MTAPRYSSTMPPQRQASRLELNKVTSLWKRVGCYASVGTLDGHKFQAGSLVEASLDDYATLAVQQPGSVVLVIEVNEVANRHGGFDGFRHLFYLSW